MIQLAFDQRPRRTKTENEGYGKASQSTAGLLSPEVRRVLADFAEFTSPAARARFADKWISLVAPRFETTWQMNSSTPTGRPT